jgi:NTP pyrophosphatase (non-canonical NTP hydrolase)
MTINELVGESFATASLKGFHDGLPFDRNGSLVRLALIHTEVSECTQEVKRNGLSNRDAIADELADILIRVGDLAGTLDLDLEQAVRIKMLKNLGRPKKYGTPEEEK